jgi:NAD(P)-dependent dehydrogenase (short-subunit alcohol dehydrogenase family)
MDLGVHGRVHAILGGTRGMGLAAAEVLAEEGARVALIGRDLSRAERAASDLEARTGTRALGLAVEENATSGEWAIARVERGLGPLRGLVAVAGPMGAQGAFHVLDDEAWESHFETQLMSAVQARRAALPRLVANGGGTLVTTAAYSVRAQKPTLSACTAMKSAIVSFTKNVARPTAPAACARTVCAPA